MRDIIIGIILTNIFYLFPTWFADKGNTMIKDIPYFPFYLSLALLILILLYRPIYRLLYHVIWHHIPKKIRNTVEYWFSPIKNKEK
jgi:hypothetical protein